MRNDMKRFRARELNLPTREHLASRVPEVYHHRMKSKALELGVSSSELFRFLAAKGAEHYGIDLLSVLP